MADARRHRHGQCAPENDANNRGEQSGTTRLCSRRAERHQHRQRNANDRIEQDRRWREQHRHDRPNTPNEKRRRARQRCLNRIGRRHFCNAKLVARMCTQRVLRHQRGGDFLCHRFRQATANVDASKFTRLAARVGGLLLGLAGKIGGLGIGLTADRDIFARCHRHRPRRQRRHPRQQYGMRAGIGGGDANDDACRRQYAIVGTEDGGAQPADSGNKMLFAIVRGRGYLSCHKCR